MLKKIILSFLMISSAFWLAFAQEDTLKQSMKRGEAVYSANCANCHMAQGEGVESAFPPLAKTAYLKNQKRAIEIVLNGLEGEIIVNGQTYSAVPMAPLGSQLSDKEIADVLNYVSNSWGNKNPMIKPLQVKAGRK
ncbi:hypothetical protein BH11BAC3_BH11BAC3_21840 [soil metagenome]